MTNEKHTTDPKFCNVLACAGKCGGQTTFVSRTDFDFAQLTIVNLEARIKELEETLATVRAPIPMRIACPNCGNLHIDEGEFATKPHHTHACQTCGLVWRPAIEPTVGVRFLPGLKNDSGA